MNRGKRALLASTVAAWLGGLVAIPAAPAQPVVQPLPRASASQALNAALARLGRDPRDLDALIDAGKAALGMGDIDAAIGFFARADQLSPNNMRVKAGLAAALVRSENPYDAIPLFAEADKAGSLDPMLLSDRGLAYDLVGDNATAQRYYRDALASQPNDETVRRLALSQAIAGDRAGMELTLAPLLQRQDKAAWRTRTFALAILQKPEEAIAIADQTMPDDMAQSLAPYLRYMPRLTAAQQAAAANFGRFPRAAEIGRDDPRVALYAPPKRVVTADVALVPAGKPLGRSKPARGGRDDRRASADPAGAPPQIASAAPPEPRRAPPPDPMPTRQSLPPPSLAVAPPGAPAAGRSAAAPAVATAAPSSTPALTSAAAAPPVASPRAPQVAVAAPGPLPAGTAPALLSPSPSVPASTPVSSPTPPPAAAGPAQGSLLAAGGGFDLARIGAGRASPAPQSQAPVPASTPAQAPAPVSVSPATSGAAVASAPAPQPTAPAVSAPVPPQVAASAPAAAVRVAPPPPAPAPRPAPARRALAEAFADLAVPQGPVAPAPGAVDVRKIAAAKPKPAEPPKPVHPSRIWVQVGTGRNPSALAFTWKALVRENPELFRGKSASTADWGRTNRLLTGPFASESQADAFLARLKKAGLDAFEWISPTGQPVDDL